MQGAMNHQLECICGKVLTVSTGAAGQQLPCACGRKLQVPTLRELRVMAGAATDARGNAEAGPTPEFEIEQLLLAGFVPEDQACASCDGDGAEVVRCWVICAYARVRVPYDRSDLLLLLAFFTPLRGLALLSRLLRPYRETKEIGRDITFPLPVRLCPACREDLTDSEGLKAALRRTPEYVGLLDKYPQATASLAQLE
jgi:hypothetical protein